MSDRDLDIVGGARHGAEALIARATTAETRVRRDLAVAIDDFFLPEAARLDERTRAALGLLLRAMVDAVEADLRGCAAELLTGWGEETLAGVLNALDRSTFATLAHSALLRNPELMAELIARVRQDAIGAALPMQAPDDPEQPSLINRFVQHPDQVLANEAMGVLVAESRRRGSPDAGRLSQTDLPADLHHRLLWWVAAALRRTPALAAVDRYLLLDRALCEAAQRALAAYDDGDRLEAAALRFAAALDPQPEELAELLVESLGDRRLVLFTALLAHALSLSYPAARDLVLDPGAERLWLGLRALDLDREAIAHIGYALCEADPRRDIEQFADLLDTIAAIAPEQARDAVASLRLHPEYRAALIAIEREGAR